PLLFFFIHMSTTYIYTLSLHDALPIWSATKSRSFPTIPVSRFRCSTPITSYGGRGTGERDGWWTGGRSSGVDERAAPGCRGARLGRGGAAPPDLRCHTHPPRSGRPACDPHECERGHRDRRGGGILFPHGSQSPTSRPRRAAVLQDPSRIRHHGARRARVAAHEPRRGAAAAAASAHRSVRRARMVPGVAHGDLQLRLSLRDGLTMKTFLRHLVLCSLPLVFAVGSGHYFTTIQGSCGAMVGALFSGKCAGRQRQYLVRFQLGGGAAGTVIAATL